MIDRRHLLKLSASAALVAGTSACVSAAPGQGGAGMVPGGALDETMSRLQEAAARPVLRTDRISGPVIIEAIDILLRDENYFVRVTDTDGGVGWALTNSKRFPDAWPILQNRIAPFFIGKNARDYEQLLEDVFIYESNYKWQGLALWICMARLELAILDLLGHRSGLPVHALLGDKVRDSTGIYYANGDRKNSAEWVVDRLKRDVARSGAKAVKFKLGARMRMTEESTRRDLKLIPMMREAFGPEMVIYADANSSYDVATAIRMGQLMQSQDYGFFEEPVQWDHLEDTRRVAEALEIPVAGGEQETSQWRFEWQLAAGALQVVQPDLMYYGGLVRSLRVARMAQALGLMCVPHISGQGLGSVSVTHFASLLPNTTDFQEYKGDPDTVPYVMAGTGERFAARAGRLPVPETPGLGVEFDPDYLRTLKPVRV